MDENENPEGHVKVVEFFLMIKNDLIKRRKLNLDKGFKNRFFWAGSLILLCLACCGPAHTQILADSLNVRNRSIISLIRDGQVTQTVSPIRSIEIEDIRDDSSSLGYYYNPAKKSPTILRTQESLSVSLKKWMAFYLGADSLNQFGFELLIIVRKLRLSADFSQLLHESQTSTLPLSETATGVQLKADVFIKRDNAYYPVLRYDTLFPAYTLISQNANVSLTFTCEKLCKRLAETNLAKCLAKRKISQEEMAQHYTHKPLPRILCEQPLMGLYRSFQDFLNNKPHFIDYEIRTGKLEDSLFKNWNGQKDRIKNFWGFSDGYELYIYSGGKISRLRRINRTFYFKGIVAPTTVNTPGPWMPGNAIQTTESKLIYRYLQVDMETGNVY